MDENVKDIKIAGNKMVNIPVTQEPEPIIKEVIVKKKKRKSTESTTQTILIAILVVGICLLIVSLFGVFNTIDNASGGQVVAPVPETTTATNQIVAPETTTANSTPVTPDVQTPGGNEDVQGGANTDTPAPAGPQTDAEWLSFFNTAVNKLKTDGPAFSKAKRTQTADVQLSNPLGNAYVSAAKDKYLSDDTVVTDVAKGDKAKAAEVVSPDGDSFVSKLEMSDIKKISHTVNADGNYEITIDMPDATNPDKSSSYAKVFQFMLVDDVMNTYAPNMNATVARENVFLNYTGCYAKAVITPEGQLVSYATKVNANMILKDAKVKVVNTDLDVTLFSDTTYTNIVW